MNGLLLSMSIGKFHSDEITEEKLHHQRSEEAVVPVDFSSKPRRGDTQPDEKHIINDS